MLSDPAARVKDIAERYGVSRATLYRRVGVVQPLKQGYAAELRGQAEFIKKQLTQLEAEKRAMATDTKVSALS